MKKPFRLSLVLMLVVGSIGVIAAKDKAASGSRSKTKQQQLSDHQLELARLTQANAELQVKLTAAVERLEKLSQCQSQTPLKPPSKTTDDSLKDLAKLYPDFCFDPVTGVSKMETDVLFAPGSTDIHPKGREICQQLARLLNSGEQRKLQIQIVGHTDDRELEDAETKLKHGSHWNLATNRANAFLELLVQAGVDSKRVGSAGFGAQSPVQPKNAAPDGRSNRRVEIFALVPESPGSWHFEIRQPDVPVNEIDY